MAPSGAVFADGKISNGSKSAALTTLVGALGMAAEGSIEPGEMDKKFSQQS